MALNEIQFAEKDPVKVESQIITLAETLMSIEGETPLKLFRADPRRLMLMPYIAALIQVRNDIDHTAKMNLLKFATGDFLDYQGHQLCVSRLPAEYALTTLCFELSAVMPHAILIPKGTRATPDGTLYFATTQAAEVRPGEKYVEVIAECLTPGYVGNGWVEGQITQQVDRLPGVKSVYNVTSSSGGADAEEDENFRERIQLAPESFSVAGPRGAYIFWAKTAHSGIADVSVLGPSESEDIEPGNVEIYPLMADGMLPPQEILAAVYEICSYEDIRPLTDYVHVLEPKVVTYDLNVRYWIDRARSTSARQVKEAIEQSVTQYEYWQRTKMGRDINPDELVYRMKAAGAKRVEIVSPSFQKLTDKQIAFSGTRQLEYGGLEDE